MAAVLPEPDRAAEDASRTVRAATGRSHAGCRELRQTGRADEERAASERATRQRLAGDVDRARDEPTRASIALRTNGTRSPAAPRPRPRPPSGPTPPPPARSDAPGEEAAERAATEARVAANEAEAAASSANETLSRSRAELEGLAARREALDQQLESGPDEARCEAARARGGRRFSDGLEVEPELRLAVESALGDVLAGLVVEVDDARRWPTQPR